MSMTDPIADLLTRLRNAQMRGLENIQMPGSKLKKAILALFLDEGFVAAFSEELNEGRPILHVTLKYYKGAPVIEMVQRVSRPGRRVYLGAKDLPVVKNGLGEAIVSTSRGLMTARKAKAAGVGGEILCVVA